MVSARVVISNRLGLHARPAMSFTEAASVFTASITVRRCDSDERVDGKSIMQMLLLAGTQGTELEVCADGCDENEALKALVALVERRFDEE